MNGVVTQVTESGIGGVLLQVMEGGESTQKSYVFRKPKLKHDILAAIMCNLMDRGRNQT
jgi:hypothetical protein